MEKIRKSDQVVVITGKDKGKVGKVLKVINGCGRHKVRKFLVENIKTVKKHVKSNPNKNVEGGVFVVESPIDASNVAIWNPKTEKADRVKIKALDDGKRVRVFKSNEELVDN